MTIDFHTHAFAQSIARRALGTLSAAAGALRPMTDGTVAGLEEALSRAEAVGVLLPVATNPLKLRSINDWAASQASARIIPFGAAHPLAPDALEQARYVKSLGLKGVKLHPEYQGYAVEDPRALALYRELGRLGLITVFHAGLDPAFLPPAQCEPEALARALDAFDGGKVVAAHFGGYMRWEAVLDRLAGLGLYLDTSFSYGRMIKPLAARIIERHGVDRILFGSDQPWSSIEDERAFIQSLGLARGEEEKILHGNARALLGI